MPLETPPTPVYGPDTFKDLASLAAILRSNDDFLKALIDAIPAPVVPTKAAINLASGYSHNASYATTSAIKTGNYVTLECGVINCPASFAAATYYTLGTVPAGYAITDGKNRMGVGAILTASGFIPIQYRINSTGAINFYSQVAAASVYYIVLAPINWDVRA